MSDNGSDARDVVVRAYSDRADLYDGQGNLGSCWGVATARLVERLRPRPEHRLVLDVGCGTGHVLRRLAAAAAPAVRFVGVEPAESMRRRAATLLRQLPNVRIVDGRFEELPLEDHSVDYLYSVLAFHWTTDVERSIREIARVLRPGAELDLFFTGRHTGREFTRKTTPIFVEYLGPALLLQSASIRKHLTLESAIEAFGHVFDPARLAVSESFETYYDDLDGHWAWWVARAAGHFTRIPEERREECDRRVRAAIASLQQEQGIPYTVHLLHVRLGN